MRRRRSPGSRRLLLWLLVLCLVLAMFMAERRMTPVMAAYAEKQAEILGVDTIVRALRDAIAGVSYDELIAIGKDESGRVTFVQVNTILMNRILADVERSVQESLRSLEGTVFDIPLGLLLGSDLFAAYGPSLSARIMSIGSVRVGFDHSFQTAGINQTQHTVLLETEARVRVLVPLRSQETLVSTRIPIVETVIVGPIPDQFLNLDWLFPRTLEVLPGNAR